jgi:hypothetical protein
MHIRKFLSPAFAKIPKMLISSLKKDIFREFSEQLDSKFVKCFKNNLKR